MAKSLFEELGWQIRAARRLLNTVLDCTRRRRTANRHMGTAASGLSEAEPQGYIHQSAHKR